MNEGAQGSSTVEGFACAIIASSAFSKGTSIVSCVITLIRKVITELIEFFRAVIVTWLTDTSSIAQNTSSADPAPFSKVNLYEQQNYRRNGDNFVYWDTA